MVKDLKVGDIVGYLHLESLYILELMSIVNNWVKYQVVIASHNSAFNGTHNKDALLSVATIEKNSIWISRH